MMSRRPTVSICIPTFNGAKYLHQAIESALAQSLTDFELLIVDDASTDDTLSIAQAFARRDARIRVHQNSRRLGLGGNWNRCLELAGGEWIKFLFQDDYLAPECVARMYELGSARGATLVACDRDFVFEEGVPASFRELFLRYVSEHNLSVRFPGNQGHISNIEFAALVAEYPTENCIGEPTSVMFLRSACGRFGSFNTDLGQLIDWEYWMRIGVNEGLCFLDEPLAAFRLHRQAATLSNQSESGIRVVGVDALIIRHELVYNPFYEPVRVAARPGSLKQKLFAQYHGTRALAREVASQRDPADSPAINSWEQITEVYRLKESYPRALLLSSNYYFMRILKKLGSLIPPKVLP